MNVHPLFVTEPSADGSKRWVARRTQAAALVGAGYRNVKAIGMPIVYVAAPAMARKAGTLLVMPAHSLDTAKHASWNSEAYADAIESIKRRFEHVVAVIHPACIRNGHWAHAFRRRGIETMPGFVYTDTASLLNMARLFSEVGFVTTNGFGSHLVYGAMFGVRVSIFGPYAERHPDDYRHDPLFQRNPGFAEVACDFTSEKRLRQEFPWLFVDPDRAVERRAWAMYEAGVDDQLSPSALRAEFGWTASQLLRDAPACVLASGRRTSLEAWHRGPGRVHRAIKRRLNVLNV
jgi:hypothetical protein